ncbi:hypothetical protein GN956_G23388 [Arapaima gigas]
MPALERSLPQWCLKTSFSQDQGPLKLKAGQRMNFPQREARAGLGGTQRSRRPPLCREVCDADHVTTRQH